MNLNLSDPVDLASAAVEEVLKDQELLTDDMARIRLKETGACTYYTTFSVAAILPTGNRFQGVATVSDEGNEGLFCVVRGNHLRGINPIAFIEGVCRLH